MNDESILFYCIVMIVVFLFRIFLSILFLTKKKYLLDEKYYIMFFYCSLVCVVVLLTNSLITGYILLALLPIILLLYVTFAPSRVYWIINGWEITESAFINQLIQEDGAYQKASYRMSRFKIYRKTKEKRTKIAFSKLKYDEKEKILNLILRICKENVKKANKHEWVNICLSLLFILMFSSFIIFALFT